MKRGLFLIVCILSLSVVTAATPIYQYETLTLEQEINNEIVIIPTRSNYQIQFFELTLQLFPQSSYRQKVLDVEFNPIPDTNQVFSWENPQTRVLELDTSFTLETSAQQVLIKEKIPFPLENIPLSATSYLKPTTSIDINNDIKQVAQELAQDVDDLFILEHTIARWVNQNIEYNLSTITADANYPASWVLDTGYGVCDEITNLFIALNRALGIPARFVSGIAYSDSILFTEKWGNHGWAEVYFPGYGWLPYDITYQEYGKVDATHIEFKKDVDGTSPSVEYRTKGLYYNFEPEVLDFNTKIIGYGNVQEPKTKLDVRVQEQSVQFGSYNLITVTLENLQDHYTVEDVSLAKALELTYFQPQRQSVVLKPYERKRVYWLVQVEPDLDKNYIYTFPIEIYTTSGGSASTAFSVVNRAESYGKNYMSQFIEEEKKTSSSTTIECTHNEQYLLGEMITLTCTSPEILESICFKDTCESQSSSSSFSFTAHIPGVNTAIVTTTQQGVAKKHFFTYEVLDQATLEISQLNITQNVNFENFATLKVKLTKNSSSNPQNVTMKLEHEMLQKEWFFSFLDKDKSFDIDVPAQGFVRGENTFIVTVTYYDSTGNLQSIQESTSTHIGSATKVQNLLLYYNTYAAKIISLLETAGISRYYAELTAPGAIMMILFGIISLLKWGILRMTRRIPPVN